MSLYFCRQILPFVMDVAAFIFTDVTVYVMAVKVVIYVTYDVSVYG